MSDPLGGTGRRAWRGEFLGWFSCAGSWVWSQSPQAGAFSHPRGAPGGSVPTLTGVVGAGESQKQTKASCGQMWGAFGVSEPPRAGQHVVLLLLPGKSPSSHPFPKGISDSPPEGSTGARPKPSGLGQAHPAGQSPSCPLCQGVL